MKKLSWATRFIVAVMFLNISFLLLATPCPAQTFANPLMAGADPWIVYDSGIYYSVASYMNACTTAVICGKSSTTLTGLANAPWVGLWSPPSTGPNCCADWAPELHKINGNWYIYYAASDGIDSHHRLFVLQANSSDPLGSYSMGNTGAPNGQLVESTGGVGIDPDVFTATNGILYLTWSCGYSGLASTCVAQMSDPLHVTGTTALISKPTLAWETRHNDPTQEGQVGFTHSGHTYIMYSASPYYVWDSYCVGLLVNTNGNILDPNSWTKVGPIFDRHGTAGDVASFVFAPSPDGTETWTFYQGVDGTCTPDKCRNIRMQKIYWASDGTPVAGYPFNSGVSMPVPSGEQGYVGTGSTFAVWGNAYGDAAEGDTVDGKVIGSWTSPDANTTSSTSLGAGWHQNFSGGNPNFENYTLTAGLQWVQTGTTSAFPKYGVWAAYSDVKNNVSVWIDIKYGVLTTDGIVGGKDLGFLDCPLPAGFVPSNINTLQIQKAGSVFSLSLNGKALSGSCTGRDFTAKVNGQTLSILNGQIGAVTEDTKANYSSMTVSNTY